MSMHLRHSSPRPSSWDAQSPSLFSCLSRSRPETEDGPLLRGLQVPLAGKFRWDHSLECPTHPRSGPHTHLGSIQGSGISTPVFFSENPQV